jgi:hypothetical protein
MLMLSTLFYHLTLIGKLPSRVPQDIPSDSLAKNNAPGSESPKVDKPSSTSAEKSIPATLKLPGLEDVNVSTSASRNSTSPSIADSRRDDVHQSSGPDPPKRQEAPP